MTTLRGSEGTLKMKILAPTILCIVIGFMFLSWQSWEHEQFLIEKGVSDGCNLVNFEGTRRAFCFNLAVFGERGYLDFLLHRYPNAKTIKEATFIMYPVTP